MNSRERIIAAIHHNPVDRVPIDFGGTQQSGISVWAYARLRERLGLRRSALPRVFDAFQMHAEIEQDVAERFGADCVLLNRPAMAFEIRNENWKPFTFLDGLRAEVPGAFNPEEDEASGLMLKRNGEVIAAMPRTVFYFDRFGKYPGAAHPDLSHWRAPRVDAVSLEHCHRQAEALFGQTDKAVVAAFGPLYELFFGIGLGGFEEWMMTFASEPEYVDDLYGELVDAWLENLDTFYETLEIPVNHDRAASKIPDALAVK